MCETFRELTDSPYLLISVGSDLSIVSVWGGAFQTALHFPHMGQMSQSQAVAAPLCHSENVPQNSFTFIASKTVTKTRTLCENVFDGAQFHHKFWETDISHFSSQQAVTSEEVRLTYNPKQHYSGLFFAFSRLDFVLLSFSVHRLRCVCVNKEKGVLQESKLVPRHHWEKELHLSLSFPVWSI